jgi:hypothetical protein
MVRFDATRRNGEATAMPRKSADKSKTDTPAAATPTAGSTADRETFTAIGVRAFHSLVRKVMAHKNTIREHVSACGGLISDAVENENLHKGAFGWYTKLLKMDAGKRAEWLFNFDLYRERGEFDAQGDMLPDRAELDAEADMPESDKQAAPPTLAGAMAQAIDDDKRDMRPRHLREASAQTPAPTDEEPPPVKH